MTGWCAHDSRARGEPPLGTASRARRWILLEQPGAWGRDALAESDLPEPVADRLRALAQRLPSRVLLLRRPGGVRPSGDERRLYAGVTGPGGGWLEAIDLPDVHALLDLDLAPLADAATVGGERIAAPIYLVCTNGKHDRCCALYGLPVAQALDELVGDRAWECSHVGGDRFAGNLVCLPDGLFYGHLDADTARVVVAANETGRVDLDHLRGRSCHPFPVQAAEILVRRRLGATSVDDLHVTDVRRDGERHLVGFVRAGGGELEAEVVTARDGEPVALTCNGGPARAPRYELVALRER